VKVLSEETETLSALVKQKAYEAARKYIDFLETKGVDPEEKPESAEDPENP